MNQRRSRLSSASQCDRRVMAVRDGVQDFGVRAAEAVRHADVSSGHFGTGLRCRPVNNGMLGCVAGSLSAAAARSALLVWSATKFEVALDMTARVVPGAETPCNMTCTTPTRQPSHRTKSERGSKSCPGVSRVGGQVYVCDGDFDARNSNTFRSRWAFGGGKCGSH